MGVNRDNSPPLIRGLFSNNGISFWNLHRNTRKIRGEKGVKFRPRYLNCRSFRVWSMWFNSVYVNDSVIFRDLNKPDIDSRAGIYVRWVVNLGNLTYFQYIPAVTDSPGKPDSQEDSIELFRNQLYTPVFCWYSCNICCWIFCYRYCWISRSVSFLKMYMLDLLLKLSLCDLWLDSFCGTALWFPVESSIHAVEILN